MDTLCNRAEVACNELRLLLGEPSTGTIPCGLSAGLVQKHQIPTCLYAVFICLYRLDTSPLQQLAKQNYGAEVIKYAGGSPLTGKLAAPQEATV